MCKKQKTDNVSIGDAVSYAKKIVSAMPSWKTDGFDQRDQIVLKAPSIRADKKSRQ